MKFWLVVFLFADAGNGSLEFVNSDNFQVDSEEVCVLAAAELAAKFINTGAALTTFCVSDDHYQGVKQDANVEYDYLSS